MPKTRPKTDESGRTIIYDRSEIPAFANEAQEQVWWEKHNLAAELFRQPVGEDDLPPARTSTRFEQIAVRVESEVLKRLKHLARKKGMGYQTLLKAFVLERLYEEEKREGIVD